MESRDMEILEISVKTKKSENTVDLAEDLKIDSANINEAFCEQPAKYAWWATVAAQAKALVDRKKLEVDRKDDFIRKTLIGELDAEVRQELEMNGEKVTETKVTNSIYCHPRYKEEIGELYALKSELNALQQNLTTLEIAKESMNQRKDMLISLGAQLRQEGNNVDLSLRQMSDKANGVVGSRRRNSQ